MAFCLVIPVFIVAFVVRTLAIVVLRPRHPNAADAVNRWWVWTPLIVVLILGAALLAIITWNVPLLGLGLTVGTCVAVYRAFFTASSTGSPFRPRR